MDTLTERLERLAELQKKNIEPLQTLGDSAFAAFERMARKNYELMGDMVEYAVAQSRGSIEQDSPQALYERQMSEARAFAERMSERAAEYLALAEQMRGEMTPDTLDGLAGAANDSATTGSFAGTPTPKATTKKAPVSKIAAKKRAAGKKKAASATKKTSAKKTSAKKTGSKKKASSKKSAAKKKSAR